MNTLINKLITNYVRGMKAIEIGGPSKILYPIYDSVDSLDGVDFSANTIWFENKNIGKDQYHYGEGKTGHLYIHEGTDLHSIADNTYDLVLSSNNLEHMANPFKAIEEWKRVLKPEGSIFLVLPKKESNFDHKRPITTFEHLLNDFNNNVDEKDLTHLEETLKLMDLDRAYLSDFPKFVARSLQNYENRCLHHHVFDFQLILQIFDHFNITPLSLIEGSDEYMALGTIGSK